MDTTSRGTNDLETAQTAANQPPQTQTYPLALLKGVVIFPDSSATLSIGREKTLEAVRAANTATRKVFVAVAQRDEAVEDPGKDDAYAVGSLVEIQQYEEQSEQTIQLTVVGLQRVRIVNWTQTE